MTADSLDSTRCSSNSRSEESLEKGAAELAQPQSTSAVARYFNADVDIRGADVMVLLCWFTTGFLDSTIFNAYRTFVSMQTGNTIFIGLGASNFHSTLRPYGWLKSLSSLIAFLAGCLFFSRVLVRLGTQRRLTFATSFLIQTAFIFIAAVLVQIHTVESRLEYVGEDIDFHHLIPIILLSFQAPGQTCMGRQVGMPEVPTVVVTTMIYDFGSDDALFAGLTKNGKRNRRFGGFVCMLIGAILGGLVTTKTKHILVSLWVACAIKAGMTLAWTVWPRKR